MALVALWAVFAAASVGVGFAAAGLVGDPFTDGTVGAADSGAQPATSSGPPTTEQPSATSAPGSSGAPQATSTRTLTTRGGLVSATCRDGLVRVNASPAVGWQIDEIESDDEPEARVRFERSGDGDGRVDVKATCAAGTPRFSVDEEHSGEDQHSGDGSD